MSCGATISLEQDYTLHRCQKAPGHVEFFHSSDDLLWTTNGPSGYLCAQVLLVKRAAIQVTCTNDKPCFGHSNGVLRWYTKSALQNYQHCCEEFAMIGQGYFAGCGPRVQGEINAIHSRLLQAYGGLTTEQRATLQSPPRNAPSVGPDDGSGGAITGLAIYTSGNPECSLQ